MTRHTKATLAATLWSASSGVGSLAFADLVDTGVHPTFARVGLAINLLQLAASVGLLFLLALLGPAPGDK